MLVDVKFRQPDSTMALILGVIGSGDVMPRRIGQGLYECGHWSVEHLSPSTRERWSEEPYSSPEWDEYGVCDSPDQVVEKYKLDERPERLFVTFVKIEKATQPLDGGWRWHKWGDYIGAKKPEHEYIAHEGPDIESVYTFHIYELV